MANGIGEFSIIAHLNRLVVLSGCCLLSLTSGCDSAKDQAPARSLAVVPAVKPVDAQGVRFEDVAQRVGLTHVWPQQPRPMRANEAFGCGCATFDFDNDGWQDILLVADPHPVLYRNSGRGTFEDVTAARGLKWQSDADWTGCAIADYDGDGWLDVLLTGFHRLALLRNAEGQRFENVTESTGLDPQNHEHWGSSAGFMDLDGDGWLDLVILNYVVFGPDSKQYCEFERGVLTGCPPKEYPPEFGEIWRNTGRGTFEMQPGETGMKLTHGVNLVLAFADLDDDGRMDFYVGNDGVDADLMHNLGEMRFENLGVASGLAFSRGLVAMAAMAADWGDYDRDGLLDLAVSNFQHLSFAVFRNQGQLSFKDTADRTGISAATKNRLGFGANWLDFDNDGWPDLAFINGHVYDNVSEAEPDVLYRQPTMLMRNDSGKTFTDLVPVLHSSVARPLVGRGSASVDFDNDGRVDFLAVDYEGSPMLLRNLAESKNHWLKLELRAASPNTFAYGARAVGKSGTTIWRSEVSPAASYLSSKDSRIHWGLGDVQQLDSLTIRWPSGRTQTLNNVACDQILRIEESSDEAPSKEPTNGQ